MIEKTPETQQTEDGEGVVDQQVDNQLPDPTAEEALRLADAANAGTAAEQRQPDDADLKDTGLSYRKDPRDKIAKSNRARRQAEMRGEATDINDPALTYGAPGVQAEQGNQPAKADGQEASEQEEAAQPSSKRKFKLKVDGQEVERELSDDEITTILQKDMTADQRLREAARLRQLAEERLAAAPGSNPPTNANDEDGSGRQADPAPTKKGSGNAPTPEAENDQDLADAVQTLQIGTPDEGVKALKKVLERAAPPQQSVDIGTQVANAIAHHNETQKSTEAMQKFADRFSVLKSDEDGVASAVLMTVLRGEILKDLKAVGFTEEVIRQHGLDDPGNMKRLNETHKMLRIKNVGGVRTVEQILDIASKDKRFTQLAPPGTAGQPKPQVELPNRAERKDGVQQQPALRSAPPRQTQQPTEQTRTRNLSGAVTKMKQGRGQGTVAA